MAINKNTAEIRIDIFWFKLYNKIRKTAINQKNAENRKGSGNMAVEDIIYKFKIDEVFTKADLKNAVHEVNNQYKDSSIDWLIGKLKKECKIIKLNKSEFKRTDDTKKEYRYPYSEQLCMIEEEIQREFPLLEFQVWELVQLNEFVNHQIAHNTLFVEVEAMLEETVFEFLKKKYTGVLLKPNVNEFYKYKESDITIVVRKIVTEAPVPIKGTHFSRLEKILVDATKDKIIGSIISEQECATIFKDSFARYALDISRMSRYAARRGASQKVKELTTNM